MHNATQTQRQPETVYREDAGGSLLDAMVEMGVRSVGRPAPSVLEQIEAPTQQYSRGRRLVVRDVVVVVAQDSDVLCQGGLFGAVEPSSTPQGHRAMVQDGLFASASQIEARRGSVCVVCGDARCGIGPFGGGA